MDGGKWLIGKNVKGSSCCLISGTISEFGWRNWGKWKEPQ